MRRRFVRAAVEQRADLQAFRDRPTFRTFAGVFLIGFSFAMCWPVIGGLAGMALYLQMPLILIVGGPVIYGTSHLVFIAGMALSGARYTRALLRWLTRVGVEKLLARGRAAGAPEAAP